MPYTDVVQLIGSGIGCAPEEVFFPLKVSPSSRACYTNLHRAFASEQDASSDQVSPS